MVHAEDGSLIDDLTGRLLANGNVVSNTSMPLARQR